MKLRTKLLMCAAIIIVLAYVLFGTFPQFANDSVKGTYYRADGSAVVEDGEVKMDLIVRRRVLIKDNCIGYLFLREPNTLWLDHTALETMISGSYIKATLSPPINVKTNGFETRKLHLLHIDSFLADTKGGDYSALLDNSAIFVSPDFETIFIYHDGGAGFFTSEDMTIDETAAYITELVKYFDYQPHKTKADTKADFSLG